jgi:Phage integrase, N-terminal SAM-like domain
MNQAPAAQFRTEDGYANWARRFIFVHGKRHPKTLGAPEVEAFLTHLAVERKVSASTQNQAKAAVLFMYKEAVAFELQIFCSIWNRTSRQPKKPASNGQLER